MIKRIINKLGVYKTYPLKVRDTMYKVPVHKGLGFTHFVDSEPWMDQVLEKLGGPDFRFLDVGVNVGQTLLKWKSLFPDSVYVGFEPNTACVHYVLDLIEKNKIVACHLHPYGLSTSESKSKLYLLGKDLGDSSATTIENFRANESRTAIDILTTPLKLKEPVPFDLIKIDVEGAELEVLQSIFEVDGNPIITCEILPVYTADNKERLERQNAIWKLLAEHNYSIYRISKQANIKLEKISEFGVHGDLALSDYVFIPNDKAEIIMRKFN
ncbi:MAG: FkbM family methyltransferase [Crocinitomix sp.]|nr:FkbM family methyltransferase [Crocinitomix sp.]